MWNNAELLEASARSATMVAVALGLLSAILGIALSRFGPIADAHKVHFGVAAGVFGLLAAMSTAGAAISDQRAKNTNDLFRRTPRELKASLELVGVDDFRVFIDSLKQVPFEFQWRLVTKNDLLVGGIPLDWSEVYPDKTPQRFNQRVASVNWEDIVDDFVELRFRWRSVYAAEQRTSNLEGSLVRKYMFKRDSIRALPNE